MSRMMKSSWFRGIVIPMLLCFLYIVVAAILMNTTKDEIITSLATDVVLILAIMPFVIREWRQKPRIPKEEKYKFSVFGWSILILTLVCLFLSSESLGNYLGVKFPSGVEGTLYDPNSSQFYIYVAMALTIGPVAEELFFRWLMFHKLRGGLSFWVSFCVSTLLFMLVHGTVMHIPVTLILALFLCVIYESTGKFSYCIVFHLLFNFMAAGYVIPLFNIPYWSMIVLYVIVMAVIIAGYIFREKVFHKVLVAGGLKQFEAYLDNKKAHFGEPKEHENFSEKK